jgi:hypothetical protein
MAANYEDLLKLYKSILKGVSESRPFLSNFGFRYCKPSTRAGTFWAMVLTSSTLIP